MEQDLSQAVPVSSIAHEYAAVAGEACECGGRFEVVRQTLIAQENHFYDVLAAVCQRCGLERQFLFIIDAFFGR